MNKLSFLDSKNFLILIAVMSCCTSRVISQYEHISLINNQQDMRAQSNDVTFSPILLGSGLLAGFTTASVMDSVINNLIIPKNVAFRVGARLVTETYIGLMIFLVGYKLKLIKFVNNRSLYNKHYNHWITAFHAAFNVTQAGRCGSDFFKRLTSNPSAIITLDDIYGVFHGLACYANSKELLSLYANKQ